MIRLLASCVVYLTLCSLASAQSPKDATPVFPASAGARWVYDVTGKEIVDVVTGVEVKDGVRYVSVGRRGEDGKTTPFEKLYVTDWCVFRLEKDGVTERPPVGLLILPLKLGLTPEQRLKVDGRIRIEEPENITVPAGTYSAYPFRQRQQVKVPLSSITLTLFEYRWYAPGVGLVQSQAGYLYGDVLTYTRKTVLKKFLAGKG